MQYDHTGGTMPRKWNQVEAYRHTYRDRGGDVECRLCGHQPGHRPEPCWPRISEGTHE